MQALDDLETLQDQFTYTVSDGTATSNSSTLTVTVFGTNDAPVAVADTNWAQEDLALSATGNVLQTQAASWRSVGAVIRGQCRHGCRR